MKLATRLPDETVQWAPSAVFVLAQFLPLLAIITGVSRTAVVLFVVLYVSRVFFITAGYHRYFAHRSYRLARVPQFIMAFGGASSAQKGPLWWAANHRDHHKYTDTDRDPHTPQKGFFWSHMGWILSPRYKGVDYERIADFAKFPELRFLDRHDWIAPWTAGVAAWLIGGWSGLVFGFFGSTVLLWHSTFAVNSFAHIVGRRRYATADTSRNNVVVAILTFGEGWHNNHHHHPSCARQGFRWWEWDPSYYILRALSWVGIVRDLREPSPAALDAKRVRAGALDVGLFRMHLARAHATVERAAGAGATRIGDLRDGITGLADQANTATRATPARQS